MPDKTIKNHAGKFSGRAALDIGTYAAKLLEVSTLGERLTLAGLGVKDIHGMSKEETVNSIKALAAECKLSSTKVNISVSGPFVIVRLISMPKMREDELKGALKFEVEKFIPFDIKDCIMDFQVMNRSAAAGKPRPGDDAKADVLVVAAKKAYIEEKISLVESAGLSVNLVDVDSLALANAYTANFATSPADKSAAILNIGGTTTNLSIMRGASLCFIRDIAVGGSDLAASIAKRLGVDIKKAEELRTSPKERLQDVIDCAKGTFNTLLDDIKLSFSYYENQGAGTIDEIYLTGGDSGMICLDEAFQESFGSKPIIWNPLGFLDTSAFGHEGASPEKMKGLFAVAAGLAMR